MQPFTLARQERVTGVGNDEDATVGLDFRMGLGTATTLSAAVNPDFGQVEQDPAVLNLSVFETFLQEKRPFFTEDSRTLVPTVAPQATMFHSRRIGQRPGRLAIPDGETVIERPAATTILGATKITGKANGWTYGGLTALTDREYALVETAAGARAERLIEPYTSYNVARVQKDIRGGSSNIGGHATAVLRESDFDAYTGSFDYSLRWGSNKYTWSGQWSGTRSAIDGVMETGFGGITNFNYNSKHVGFFGHYDYFNDTFKNNDIGFFFSRNNKTNVSGGFNLSQPDPQKRFRSAALFGNFNLTYNGDRLKLDDGYFIGGEMQFLNYWSIFLGTGRFKRAYDDLDTRGGPPIVKPAAWWFDSFVGTDTRKRYRLNLGNFIWHNEEGGSERSHRVNLTLQPRPALQATLGLAVHECPGRGAVDREHRRHRRRRRRSHLRHAEAKRRQHHRPHDLRVHPRHDARGLHAAVRGGRRLLGHPEVLATRRRSSSSRWSTTENPDFNNKSLRSNVVFRWEYRRGSTLYLVWNVSNRTTRARASSQRFGTSAAGLAPAARKCSW